MTTSIPEIVRLGVPPFALELCPSLGGSITQFRWQRTGETALDLLRPAAEGALSDGDVEGTGCFPLTPFSNRLRHGRCLFRGREIRLPRNTAGPHVEHGHGWQQPWQVSEAGPDHATLRLVHRTDAWPFAYDMQQRFRLGPDGLEIELVTRNTGEAAMPYGFGLHPYFPRTPACVLRAAVTGLWETDAEVMPTRHVAIPAALDPRAGLRVDAQALDNVLTGWEGRAVIDWPERGARLVLEAEGPLRFLVLYTPPGEDYFCAEPVSNCTDAFNLAADGRSDTGLLVIEPGAAVSARLSLRPATVR
jgi:aldose 1-epimerase